MQINVNGEFTKITCEPQLLTTLQGLGYDCEKVVVAVNEVFVGREGWASHLLRNNDRLEILAPIAGG